MDILEDASLAWQTLAVSGNIDDEIIVLSPFITGDLLSELVQSSTASKFTIVTALTAQSIYSGAVDLAVLESLLETNCSLLSCKGLHAKLMKRGSAVILGSQNFTTGGIHNLELSVQMDALGSNQDKLNKFIEKVISQSGVINNNLLSILKQELDVLHVERDELNEHYEKINVIIQESFEAQYTASVEAETPSDTGIVVERASEKHLITMGWDEDAEVSWFERMSERREFGTGPIFPKSDLTKFVREDGSILRLLQGYFYFCIDTETLQPFFMKANKTRTSFIVTNLLRHISNTQPHKISITLRKPTSSLPWNISLQIGLNVGPDVSHAHLVSTLLFDGTNLSPFSYRIKCFGHDGVRSDVTKADFERSHSKIPTFERADILTAIFEPFYSPSQKEKLRPDDIYSEGRNFELIAKEIDLTASEAKHHKNIPFLVIKCID
ncbi:hypothetical protein HIMB100_00012420 [SAR116 cluster alpha proteobacterium HIMB100]|nr:hypothetical protein HIMB100_00012420 [SAR116 cluster alpha proteobacterium HIMB100]